jgi:O-antigen biosynthesis protein
MTSLINSLNNYKKTLSEIALIFFKAIIARARGKNRLSIIPKALRVIKDKGLSGVYAVFFQSAKVELTYSSWIILNDTLRGKDRKAIRSQIQRLRWKPMISILMSIENTSVQWLKKTIESVRSQLYPNWELFITYDYSVYLDVASLLKEYEHLDNRIRVIYQTQNLSVSVALNSILESIHGEFIALLCQHDQIPEHALYMFAMTLNEKSHLDLIYSDEDRFDEKGQRFDPYFKPDWNPVLFTSHNMISHLSLYRTNLVCEAGGFRKGYDKAQDWDLALRVSEKIPASHIHHIPYILYHKREITDTSAIENHQNFSSDHSEIKVLNEHLQRTKNDGTVTSIDRKHFRIRYTIPSPMPFVSIIIPTRNGLPLLRRCVESILGRTCYPHYEILIVDNQSDDSNTLDYIRSLESQGLARILRYNFPFNYSAINNFAVDTAKGNYLCLMNNDIEVISEDWLNEMLSFACRPEIGAVGAMLYYPNNTIQHAGVLLGMGGVAGHLYLNQPRGTEGYKNRAQLCQYLSAVTAACLVVKKAIYVEVGGLDEKNLPVAFNDVDFCLRIEEHGYRNVWTPFSELYHHEFATRGHDDTVEKKEQFDRDYTFMMSRWGHRLKSDPAYNANLSLEDYSPNLAFTPRIEKPWKIEKK